MAMPDGVRDLAGRMADRLPESARARAYRLARDPRFRRALKPAWWGTLRRLQPLSNWQGYERGTPIDTFYIEQFIAGHQADIRGRVLEAGSTTLSSRFGGDSVARTDVVDANPYNPEATVLADLSETGSLPAATFDCIVLPVGLQLVTDLPAALANLWQSLAPGGSLMLCVPGMARVLPGSRHLDAWRLNPLGLERLLISHCVGSQIEVTSYGNVLTAVAFMMGISAEELRPKELNTIDRDFPVLCCAHVKRWEEP
jgi:SAM-dependent methyltransferase